MKGRERKCVSNHANSEKDNFGAYLQSMGLVNLKRKSRMMDFRPERVGTEVQSSKVGH